MHRKIDSFQFDIAGIKKIYDVLKNLIYQKKKMYIINT